MTPKQIRELRTKLNFTVAAFATLLGVSTSAVSRWERSKDAATVDPGTAQLLIVLASCVETKKNVKDRTKFVEELHHIVTIHGRLRGLHLILSDHFADAA